MEHGLSGPGLSHCTGPRCLREVLPDTIEIEAMLQYLSAQLVCQRFRPLRSFGRGQQLCLHVPANAGGNPEPDDQRAEEPSDKNPHTKDRAINHG